MKLLTITMYLGFLLSGIIALDVFIPKPTVDSIIYDISTVQVTQRGGAGWSGTRYGTGSTTTEYAYEKVWVASTAWMPIGFRASLELRPQDSVSYQKSRILGQVTNIQRIRDAEGQQINSTPPPKEWTAMHDPSTYPDRYYPVRGIYSWWGIIPAAMLLISLLSYPKRKDIKALANRVWCNFFLIPFSIYLLLFGG